MPSAEGITETTRATRYLTQLCKHLAHRGMQVDNPHDHYATADFRWGTCTLTAQPE